MIIQKYSASVGSSLKSGRPERPKPRVSNAWTVRFSARASKFADQTATPKTNVGMRTKGISLSGSLFFGFTVILNGQNVL